MKEAIGTEKVTKTIAVRCTPSQHELINRMARREGRSASNYMVQLALKDAIDKELGI